MSLSNRALWIIDRNLDRDLSLAGIADACSVSRHHLAHAFGQTVGMTVMDYVRGRRLSEAAQRLAAGTKDILQLALASGYGSHEAFSRAFRTRFSSTPEAVRHRGSAEGLPLIQPIQLDKREPLTVAAPRFHEQSSMLAVGIKGRFSFGDVKGITALWRQFGPEVGAISNKAHFSPVGIATPCDDDGYDYACAVLVRDFSEAPSHLARVRVPPQRYAVFRHAGHVSEIRTFYEAILNDWLPGVGLTVSAGPIVEYHASGFDPMTGEGGLDIWLPMLP